MSARQPKDWTPERHEACKARVKAATKGPWKWWTSNSHRRLTAEDCQDGGVAYGTKQHDGCGDIVIGEADMAFTEHAREDVPDMLSKIESLTAEVEFYKRRERDICAAIGGVGDGGKYRNDIIAALRNRLRPAGPLTEGVKRDIRKAFANLCGSGVPEEHLARMHADHAIGLLENQRPEWFAKAPTGESKRRFKPGDRVVTADRLTGSAAYLPAHGRVRNMPGMIVRQRESPVPRFDVRHDKDGVIAPYDADELTEENPHE